MLGTEPQHTADFPGHGRPARPGHLRRESESEAGSFNTQGLTEKSLLTRTRCHLMCGAGGYQILTFVILWMGWPVIFP
ncbi:hypothetical protein SALBM135S_09363 [Streptomyces alboniger]